VSERRTGNAEMLDDLVVDEGIKRTFVRSGAKLLFGNSAKIIVPRSWLGRRVTHSFTQNTLQQPEPKAIEK
jgi:putative transposon-encoded protein